MSQKNFSLGGNFADKFDGWCRDNAYPGNKVFVAASLAFAAMSHEERTAWFAKTGDPPGTGAEIVPEKKKPPRQLGQHTEAS